MTKLLTIAVPTYNRSKHLERLLAALARLPDHARRQIEFIVSDNASSDDTSDVVARFCSEVTDAVTIRNASNIGADANVAQCFRGARGNYVWIIGDDDIPKAGVVAAALAVLGEKQPDILYAPSEWLADVVSDDQGARFDPVGVRQLNRLEFARTVNVWLTFLSGIIVRKSACNVDVDASLLDGSCVSQLSWVLPALSSGSRFCTFTDQAVLATAGNTGGYSAVRVFGVNLPRVIAQHFGRNSPEYRAIVSRTVVQYLPQLVWTIRSGKGGGLGTEMPWRELREQIGGFPAFWALVVPVGRAPKPLGRLALAGASFAGRVQRFKDRRQSGRASQ